MEIKSIYDNTVNLYLQQFIDKHECAELEYWIGEPGDIAVIGDYFINFSDIKYDIDNNVNPDLFWDWYYFEINYKGKHRINFNSWVMGYKPSIVFISTTYPTFIRNIIKKFCIRENEYVYVYEFMKDWSYTDIEDPFITELKKSNRIILPPFWQLSKKARLEHSIFKTGL